MHSLKRRSGPPTWRPGRSGVLRRLGGDHGAVATIVAILVAGGVLLGTAALVVDVGQLYTQREQLQTEADAAAVAVAKSCATDPSSCTDVNRANIAKTYADANSDNNLSNFVICGSVPGVYDLSSCDSLPQANNLTSCVGTAPAAPQPYIEVHTATILANGSTLLPPTFAQTLLGGRNYHGTTVGACARATWGAPKYGMAVTFSYCEFDDATDTGTNFAPAPPYTAQNPVPAASFEIVLRLHDAQAPPADPNCPQGPPNWDRPGGFGYLKDPSDTCNTDLLTAGPTGVTQQDCIKVLQSITTSESVAQVVYIPIYSAVKGTGSNATYQYTNPPGGMAAFVPTGYFLGTAPGQHQASWLTGNDYSGSPYDCTGDARCIFGYFVAPLVPGPTPISKLHGLGVNVVSLIG